MASGKYICPCKKVTREDVVAAMQAGATSFKQVQKVTGAAGKCGKCEKDVRRFMESQQGNMESPQATKQESKPKQGKVKVRLRSTVLECRDAAALADFYHKLLGGKGKLRGEGRYVEFDAKGAGILAFSTDEAFQPPAWPPQDGRLQAHLDLQVKSKQDMQGAVDAALALGASLPAEQFGGDSFTTLIDPQGHPFCLVPGE